MRYVKWTDKLIFLINSVLAFVLLLSYSLPYISPSTFPLLSVLSLAVPLLLVINGCFLCYWAARLKKQLLLSLLILLLGLSHLKSLYKFGGNTKATITDQLTLLSYNVHQFDRFDWIKDNKTVGKDISDFVKEQEPMIFCAQEFYYSPNIDFSYFKYKYIDFNNNTNEVGQAIYSQLPIINKGTLKFERTANNAVFVDVRYKRDTIRIYNVHFQSHRISPNAKALQREAAQKLLKRISGSFVKQQTQMEQVLEHMKKSPYKNIVAGDFNNTAYSYIYDKFREQGLVDTFKERGSGFGKTYDFRFFPTRIDFILADEAFKIDFFENHDFLLSDHYPVMTGLAL